VKGIGLKLFTGKVGASSAGERGSEDNHGRRYLLRDLNTSSAEYEAEAVRTSTRSSLLQNFLLALWCSDPYLYPSSGVVNMLHTPMWCYKPSC